MPRFETEVKLDFKDVLIRPKRSTLKSRSEVELERTYSYRNSKREWTGVPIIAANMDTTGTFEMAAILSKYKCMTTMHKFYSPEEWAAFATAHPEAQDYVSVSAGTSATDFSNITAILDACPTVNHICLDVANGYSEFFIDHVRKVREAFPRHTIMAGNVVTGEVVEELLLVGADIIKVGIGPGSVCTTRRQTGVGYPQLSAIVECADAAHGLNGHIIGDGGCTCPGDIAKAFGGGSDFVMLGGMLAGHDESGGALVERGGSKYKIFYGMSSTTAMKKHAGGVAEYRSSEGKTVEIPYRGPVEVTLLDILGGLRSACTYVGAAKLKELSKRTTFVRVTAQLNETFRMMREPETGHGYTKLAASGGGGAASSSGAPAPISAVGGAGSSSDATSTPIVASGVLEYTKDPVGISGLAEGLAGAAGKTVADGSATHAASS